MKRKHKNNTNTSQPVSMLVEGEKEWFDIRTPKAAISDKQAKDIIEELTKQFIDRTKNDIRKWKLAREIAEEIVLPRWESIQDIYLDVSDDLHWESVSAQRRMKVTGCEFCLRDASGKENEEATKLLQRKWFKDFLRHYCDAKSFKYSLIQFGDRDMQKGFKTVKLVDRRYIVPQELICLRNLADTDGIDFTSAPYNLWTLFVQDETSKFGLIGKAAPLLLMKRNAIVAWSSFTEIFGLPFRKATTTTRNIDERNRIEQMLKTMGKAAYGLFPEGTNLELIESNKTDAYKVFDSFIERINSEISKAYLGQTGTTDTKSFEGSAKVHDEIMDDVTADDLSDLAFFINEELMPFLIMHGFPFEGLKFGWDNDVEDSISEKAKTALMVSQMGWTPTKEWVQNELDVEVEDKAEPIEPVEQNKPPLLDKKSPKAKDPDLKAIMSQLKTLYK